MDFSFLDTPQAAWSAELNQFMEYFVRDTTAKIFRRMNMMDIHSAKLRQSIHGVVYNNAGGNSALVRFYYLNFARFIEMGLGRYASDYDLGGEGIKVRNADAQELTSGSYGPVDIRFHDSTDQGIKIGRMGKDRRGKPVDRGKYHKARPFLMNTIRQETRRISERLAVQLGYTHALFISRGLTVTLADLDADKQWLKNMQYMETARAAMGALHVDQLEKLNLGIGTPAED